MDCPRCGHKQDSGNFCSQCGIEFARVSPGREEARAEEDGFTPADDLSEVLSGLVVGQVRSEYAEHIRWERLGVLASVVLFMVLAAWFGVREARVLDRAHDSSNWPRTEGRIVRSDVIYGWKDRPDIRYQYRVDEANYERDRVRFGKIKGNDKAKAISMRFPEDAAVAVYYDPEDPGTSVLIPGVNGRAVIDCVKWAVIFLLGVLALVYRYTLYGVLGLWAPPDSLEEKAGRARTQAPERPDGADPPVSTDILSESMNPVLRGVLYFLAVAVLWWLFV